MNKKILWITQTAVLIALLVLAQYIGKITGAQQLITGSLVNLVLLVAIGVAGLGSGATVAVLSPVFAQLIGVGPAFVQLVPAIMLGNLVLVVVYHFIFKLLQKGKANVYVSNVTAVILGAVLKFGFLTLAVSQLVLPVFLSDIKAPVAAKLSEMFSLPQLFTALIGGAIAVLVIPAVKKALKKS